MFLGLVGVDMSIAFVGEGQFGHRVGPPEPPPRLSVAIVSSDSVEWCVSLHTWSCPEPPGPTAQRDPLFQSQGLSVRDSRNPAAQLDPVLARKLACQRVLSWLTLRPQHMVFWLWFCSWLCWTE